jgi:hypothetical protein
MPLRAAAFHESISLRRLDELFHSDWNRLFAGTTKTQCQKCYARFAVFYSDREDQDNKAYLEKIERLIAEDCTRGKHSPDILVSA